MEALIGKKYIITLMGMHTYFPPLSLRDTVKSQNHLVGKDL